jgi:hypothetical protein
MEPNIILPFTGEYPKSSGQLFLPQDIHFAFVPCVLDYLPLHCGLGFAQASQKLNDQKAMIEVRGFPLYLLVQLALGSLIVLYYSTNEFFTLHQNWQDF